MNSITVIAPAKVNLFLEVLSKRTDSFHNILTLFERISLADRIRISKIKKGIIVKSDVFITRNPEDNLVYKAARAILYRARIKSGVKIEIRKKIPIAAGLGGGSSDAAAALIGINKLFSIKLGYNILLNIAKSLGSDVPFFIIDSPFAVGRGKGDKLQPLRVKKRFWHLLVYPGFKAATKDVYNAFDGLTYRPRDDKINFPMLHNDLEEAAISISRKAGLGRILNGLACLLDKRMIISGSGPSLFCLYRTRKEAMGAKGTLLRGMPARQRRGWQVFVVSTCKNIVNAKLKRS